MTADPSRRLEEFRAFEAPASVRDRYLSNLAAEIFDSEEGRQLSVATRDSAFEELSPHYVRASLLAKKNQRLYRWAGQAVWCLFPLAVAAVAIGTLIPHLSVAAFSVELILLLVIASVVILADRSRSHEKWLECRVLTEGLRSAIYLRACGLQPIYCDARLESDSSRGRNDWVRIALHEIVCGLAPLAEATERSFETIAPFARRRWVGEQIQFHRQKAKSSRRLSRLLERAGWVAFALAILAAAAHVALSMLAQHEGGSPVEAILTFAAIVLPAVGAALGGFRAHRELSRLAKRSGDMERELTRLDADLAKARNLGDLDRALRETERLMSAEVEDWRFLMRFVPVEPPG